MIPYSYSYDMQRLAGSPTSKLPAITMAITWAIPIAIPMAVPMACSCWLAGWLALNTA
jgi:hypothetical protein